MLDTSLKHIEQSRVVAIVRLDDLSGAVDLAQALLDGGINVIEFTLTSPDAPAAIEAVRATLADDCLVGAGSVITSEQVDMVVNAGAQFVVSPVTSPAVIEQCHHHQIPVMPGSYTPTEIQAAWELNVAAVKVFPARQVGPSYIKDVLAPLPHLRLLPTGGITPQNAGYYLRAGAFAVGIGSSLLDKKAIAAGDWATIRERAQQMMVAIQDIHDS